MSDREEFEIWAAFDLMAHDFERGERGEYLDDFLQQSWLGWQAARAQSHSAGVPKWKDVVERAVDALGIMDESEGIAGWHLNGEISPWDEGDLPAIRDELQQLLAHPHNGEQGGWIRCDERMPTDADADCDLCVWICWVDEDGEWRAAREFVADIACEYSAWMPTGLIEPAPPEQGAE